MIVPLHFSVPGGKVLMKAEFKILEKTMKPAIIAHRGWCGKYPENTLIAFEKAMELKDNEFMPCMSPLGHPAARRSMRESLMRKGVKADSRIPYNELFFEGTYGTPLSEAKYLEMKDCLEAVRWAPSAVNKQPWRLVFDGDSVHFFEHRDRGYKLANGMDLQKVDLGISICHFDLALDEKSSGHEIVIDDPGLDLPEYTEYICTFIL